MGTLPSDDWSAAMSVVFWVTRVSMVVTVSSRLEISRALILTRSSRSPISPVLIATC